VVGGILLLSNRFVALGLTLLGPILVNIFLYHARLDTSGLPLAAALVVLYVIVLRQHKAAFEPLLKMKS
jgi:putative oxidoreductase